MGATLYLQAPVIPEELKQPVMHQGFQESLLIDTSGTFLYILRSQFHALFLPQFRLTFATIVR